MVHSEIRLSVMKPLHNHWIMKAFDAVKNQTDIIQSGWQQSGITAAFASATDSEPSKSLGEVHDDVMDKLSPLQASPISMIALAQIERHQQ